MNKDSLHKIISSFVIPKYPWIEEFTIQVFFDAPTEKYSIYYFVKPEEDGSFTVTEEMSEVEKLTETLFRIIGPDKNQYLNEILFIVKNKERFYRVSS